MENRGSCLSQALGVLLVVLVVLSGCEQRKRPEPAAWAVTWGEVRSELPQREAFSGSDDRALCERTLGQLRVARERVLPGPDPNLDRLARAWLDLAEGMMFECPLHSGEPAGFDAGYRELRRLALEVDLALATAGEGRKRESGPGLP
jgi:hypothetical protein